MDEIYIAAVDIKAFFQFPCIQIDECGAFSFVIGFSYYVVSIRMFAWISLNRAVCWDADIVVVGSMTSSLKKWFRLCVKIATQLWMVANNVNEKYRNDWRDRNTIVDGGITMSMKNIEMSEEYFT